ncbi:EAL domain-containing protein [Vibrio vulnificus]
MNNEMKILVVDDHPIHLTVMKKHLAKIEYLQVDTEQDPFVALNMLSACQFDVIFCDIDMPKLDGIDFMLSLNEMKFLGHVVLVSALERSIIEAVSAMCQSFSFNILGKIQKPYDLEELSKLLSTAHILMKQKTFFRRNVEVTDQEFLIDLVNGRVKNYYQPLVDCMSGEVVGYEALARWQHRIYGLLTPAVFLPIVERCNLSLELFDVVADNAVKDTKQHYLDKRISINADQTNIEDPLFSERFINKCLENGVEPEKFTIEITENTSFSNSVSLYRNLAKLRLYDVNVSIDDFGTGYSSFEKLSLLPFNELKIDRSFVSDMTHDSKKRKIINSICGLAKSLDLIIVAEGVENQSTWEMLQSYDIDICQGFLFNKPMPLEAINILSV